jgi:SARP family transcriptional regulator, regulator of embCAB operon
LATRIQLCGRVTAELEGRRAEGDLPGRQGRLLFVYLVANRHRPVARDELAALLWPERPPATFDGSLSALLSKLRRTLGEGRLEGRSELRLVLPADAWVDLEAATEGLHRAESAVARGDWAGAWGPGRVAQHVAARGFLPGEEAPWAVRTRRRLEELHVRALELVGRACVELGGAELDTAERSARTLLERAPYRESGHRLLMETLAAQGNRAEALVVYERLRTRLREDLGASPSAETQELHLRLLRDAG